MVRKTEHAKWVYSYIYDVHMEDLSLFWMEVKVVSKLDDVIKGAWKRIVTLRVLSSLPILRLFSTL